MAWLYNFDGRQKDAWCHGDGSANVGGGLFTIESSISGEGTYDEGTDGHSFYDRAISLCVKTSIAHSSGDKSNGYLYGFDFTMAETPPNGPDILDAKTGTVSWEISIDVEEWQVTYTPTSSTLIDGTSFPNNGGAQPDGIPATGTRFELRTYVGATYSVSATLTGWVDLTTSIGGTVSTAMVIPYDAYSGCSAYFQSMGVSDDYEFSYTLSTHVSGVSGASKTGRGNGSRGTWSGSCGGGSASIAVTTLSNYDPRPTASASASGSPSVNYVYSQRLRTLDEGYPGALQARCTDGSIGGSRNITQFNYGDAIQLDSSGLNATDHGIHPIALWLDHDSLAEAGEDVRDWRLQFRGYKRDSLTLSVAPSVMIEDGSIANWTAGPNTALTSFTGVVRMTATGPSGSATRAYSPEIDVELYRYIRVRARASSACTVRVNIAGKYWNLDLTATNTDYDLDMCLASDDLGVIGTRQDRFPNATTGQIPLTKYGGLGWGVNAIDSIGISNIPGGYWVQLDAISLVRDDATKLTCLAGFMDWPMIWNSPGDNTYGQPYLSLQTDGRGPFALWHMAHVVPTGSSTPNYFVETQNHFAGYLNTPQGGTGSIAADSSDTYHTGALPAYLLGGGGATYDFATQTWTDWVDRTFSGNLTIPSQDLFDEVQIYPGAGEVWTSGSYDVYTPLVTSKVLRTRAEGIVYDKDRTPFQGVAVMAASTSGVFAGVGVGDSRGIYRTDMPYGVGGRWHETVLVPNMHDISVTEWANRRRQRTSFLNSGVDCVATPARLPIDCSPQTSGVPSCASTCGNPNCASASECSCGQPFARFLPSPGGL